MTKSKLKTNWLYIVIIIFIALFVTAGILIYSKWISRESKDSQAAHSPCLSDNEIVDYTINWRQNVSPVVMVIKDQESGKEIHKFTIDSTLPVWHPVQPRKCGVYVLRIFNYDPTDIIKSAKENIYEIWYYSYNGEGKPFFLLDKDFSLEFSVDFLEIHLALIKGYLGRIDFATVIKEIKTKEDIFELLLKDITNKHPSLEGNLSLIDWTKDSRYFWGRTHYGAYTLGFFRIDTQNWIYDIFPAPQDVLGGDALNVENGYITIHPGNVWFGIAEITEEEKARRRAQGIGTEFYIENLITGERHFVDKTQEPLWYFKPEWLSDTELEYELPTGEKKIYNINTENK